MYYEDSLEPGPEADPRLGRMVRVPDDNSSPEDLAAFRKALGVPDSPDGYCIECRHEMLTPHPEINKRLHEAGFTPRQAQLVYDLAHDHVIPTIDGMRAEYEARRGLDRLKDYFGGDVRWNEAARQVSAWGKANLPPEVYAALAANPEGIIAMQKMMGSGEPMMGKAPAGAEAPLSEPELKKMMADPRYWKTRDPAWIGKVQAGFARLYGE